MKVTLVLALLALASAALAPAAAAQIGDPPVPSPFKAHDTVGTGRWWEQKPSKIVDVRVPREDVICFGIYTVHASVLKLSAQLFPLYPEETRTVRLELWQEGAWREVAREDANDLGWSALFRVEDWDASVTVRYRLRHGASATYEGSIRRDPVDKDEIVLAALSCNSNQDRGMRKNYVRNVLAQDPDLVFFAGDQSYDHKQHTAAWLKFGLQFRETFRDRPAITIPDDHDIGQGNLWGENGKKAERRDGADGGYFHPLAYVQMVERCQTSHLPDAFDSTPVERGLGVYYTSLVVGGVDFAILEDRKFKSGPAGKIPQQGPRPDHIRNPDYDPASIDVEGLTLLGERQLAFLEAWGAQHEGVALKAVLSQTGFCGGAHIHGNKKNRLHADLDSNGWPQTGRNEALRRIQAAGAVHIGGDQHLATLIQHGIDEFRDGPWAFIVPASVNNYYRRWWWPEDEQAGANRDPGSALPWTGDYLDGFGNRISMEAYVNPETASRGSGYGLIRFHKERGAVTFECWPRDVDVTADDAKQFPGFPRTITPGG